MSYKISLRLHDIFPQGCRVFLSPFKIYKFFHLRIEISTRTRFEIERKVLVTTIPSKKVSPKKWRILCALLSHSINVTFSSLIYQRVLQLFLAILGKFLIIVPWIYQNRPLTAFVRSTVGEQPRGESFLGQRCSLPSSRPLTNLDVTYILIPRI